MMQIVLSTINQDFKFHETRLSLFFYRMGCTGIPSYRGTRDKECSKVSRLKC